MRLDLSIGDDRLDVHFAFEFVEISHVECDHQSRPYVMYDGEGVGFAARHRSDVRAVGVSEVSGATAAKRLVEVNFCNNDFGARIDFVT